MTLRSPARLASVILQVTRYRLPPSHARSRVKRASASSVLLRARLLGRDSDGLTARRSRLAKRATQGERELVERGAEPPSVVASIVGTNTRLRDLVAPLLRAEGFDIGALESPIPLASAALVVIVDAADEPVSLALELCREAREKAGDADSIVVITERDDEPSLRAIVEAGADDFFVL